MEHNEDDITIQSWMRQNQTWIKLGSQKFNLKETKEPKFETWIKPRTKRNCGRFRQAHACPQKERE